MNTICICGAGTMGSGIAQVSAAAGFTTILYEVNEDVLLKAKDKLHTGLQTLVDRQKIAAQKKDDILQHLRFTSNIQECVADVVIEAIIEKVEAKVSLFNQLAALNSAETIFATNTSSLSVTGIAKEIIAPQRVAGLHFFNPAPIMKLVEIVKGEQTADEVIEQLVALTKKFGKEPVVCKDCAGLYCKPCGKTVLY